MSLSVYEATVPVFRAQLTSMRNWLDKPEARQAEASLLEARLAPDMYPLPRQFQIVSDTAKNAVARLTGAEAPSMADNEASFDELQQRCDKTIAYLESIDRSALDGSADGEVVIRFPNGMGYRFIGREYVTGFVLPNFYFHVTAAYAILRASGVPIGKPDFLQHLGPPNLEPEA